MGFYLSNRDSGFRERLPTRWPHLRLLAGVDAMSIDRVNLAGVAHHHVPGIFPPGQTTLFVSYDSVTIYLLST